MGHVENLRDIKQVGRMLARAREKQARSLSECAGLLGLKNQDLLNIENGNVFAFRRNVEQMQGITERYAELLGIVFSKTPLEAMTPVSAVPHVMQLMPSDPVPRFLVRD